MRHFVLTRSVYGVGWDLAGNRRRLAVTRGITVRCMAAQTDRDWTWVVLVDPADELLEERRAAFLSAGVPVIFIDWHPAGLAAAPWDHYPEAVSLRGKVAATAYKAGWAEAIHAGKGVILQTRLDDDDGFTPDAMERVRAASLKAKASHRMAWMFPFGIRVWRGRFSRVRHVTNAMHTLETQAGDSMTVYDYGHRLVARVARVRFVDKDPAWLWARHPDTLSGWKKAEVPLTPAVRALFPVDWSLL